MRSSAVSVLRAPTSVWGAGDVVPLPQRITGLMAVRIAGSATVLATALGSAPAPIPGPLVWSLIGYVVAVVGLSALALAPWNRTLSLTALGLLVITDSVAVVAVRAAVGPSFTVGVVMATFVAAVTLLTSFRTGVRITLWISLLLIAVRQGGQAGLWPPPAGGSDASVMPELVPLWLVAVVVGAAAAVSERELRRRRHDAEALQRLAGRLNQARTPEDVLRGLTGFLVEELSARRVVVGARDETGLRLLTGIGVHPVGPAPDPSGSPAPSALFDAASANEGPTRLATLDAGLDPWLASLLPGGRRLLAAPLTTGPDRVWVVFEHGGQRGLRVERRVLSTFGQAAALTGIGLSRARLFREIEESARRDALTGLLNRRSLDTMLDDLGRGAVTWAVVLVDVDRFKSVNDTYGHQVGDEVLAAVGDALRRTAPEGAAVARYGGEEFAVLLPGGTVHGAAALAEALRRAVAGIERPVAVTASFGVAAAPPGPVDPATVVARADAALYRAKETGRNRVVLADGPPTAAQVPGQGRHPSATIGR